MPRTAEVAGCEPTARAGQKRQPPQQFAEARPGRRQRDVDRVTYHTLQKTAPHAMIVLEMSALRLKRAAPAAFTA